MKKSKIKKCYHPPKMLSEKILEKAALGCNKCKSTNPVSVGRCKQLPMSS
ncbi:MAG TPA: hypothetical protein PK876_06430 [Elusimicrobiota bacterium]|nr:hypothetical protein [Elusimicrobiota bacterium]